MLALWLTDGLAETRTPCRLKPLSAPSRLFTVRFWPKDLGEGQVDWRGKVQHVFSGETHF